MLIDTHSHIYSDEFEADLPATLGRAIAAGITQILMPAIDSSAHQQMLALEEAYPDYCISMMGLHPCYVKDNYLAELKLVEDYFASRQFIAVGEIGLDFYWDKSYADQQYKAFHRQIELALHYNVPIAIHSRNATDECIEVVKQHQKGNLQGVFHCFSGSPEQAKNLLDLNFYLGIGGVVTFKNSGLDRVIKELGLRNVILETDAPYLAPVPFRGKRNEPMYLKYVVEKIAELLNENVEEVAKITSQNAGILFNLESTNHKIKKKMEGTVFSKIKEEITGLGFRIVNEDLNRPWGGFLVIDELQAADFANHFFPEENVEELKISEKLSPKILMVAPDKRLSWQYHHRRAELWKCIDGTVAVVLSNTDKEQERRILQKGDKMKLAIGERHRLIGLEDWGVVAEIWQHTDKNNPSDEDDIVRLQDDFGR